MQFKFEKATKKKLKARLAIDGPSGSGKTYTALVAATALAQGGRIAVIDTEHGSASLYSDKFTFDVLELNPPFSPEVYKAALKAAEEAGYEVVVIDSLSHAWEGEGGALDMADAATHRQASKNSYTAWREVTPIHRAMVEAILQSQAHIVATMRSKMEYVQEKDARDKTIIRKVGMAPIQRAGMEYEFTLVGDMDLDHRIVISKSRCDALADAVQLKPDQKFFQTFVDWLNSEESGKEQKPVVKEVADEPKPVAPEPGRKTVEVEQAAAPQTGGMSLEAARNYITSDGKRLGDMDKGGVAGVLNAYIKRLNQPHDTKEDSRIMYGMEAAKLVLKSLNGGV